MRRAATASAWVAAAALAASTGAAAGGYTIAFGRTGGNIDPSSITIRADGRVSVTGTMRRQVKTAVVPHATLARIDRLIARQRFFALPRLIRCPGELPDFAADFITVRRDGRRRTTVVRGDCNARFRALYQALATAVATPRR